MQKGQTGILILVGILVIITIASGAYYFGKSQIPKPSPTPLPSVTSVKEGDETANWKTYTNEGYNFSFKYPLTWRISEQSGTDNKSIYITLLPPEKKSHLGDNINITAHANSQQLSIEEFVRKTTPVDVNYKTVVIGGNEGKEALDIPSAQGGRYIFVKNNTYIYEIHLNTDNLDFFQDTFNQILSTFKFLP